MALNRHPSEAVVVTWLRELRRARGGACPACLKPILPGQKTELHMGKKHHRKCVRYTSRDK